MYLKFNTRKLCSGEEVIYEDEGEIHEGIVVVNDPFLHECLVEKNESQIIVKYQQLRNGLPNVEAEESDNEEPEPKRKEVKRTQSVAQLHQVDALSLVEDILAASSGWVELTYVPCINGILKV